MIDWDAIKAAADLATQKPGPPPGYFSRRQFQEESGIGQAYAIQKIAEMKRAGMLDEIKISGRPWYRLKK